MQSSTLQQIKTRQDNMHTIRYNTIQDKAMHANAIQDKTR